MTILPRGVGFATTKVVYDGPLRLRFGRLTLAFRPADDSVRFSIEETHVPFVVPHAAVSDLELECRIGDIRAPATPVTHRGGDAWELRRDAAGGEDIVFRGGAKFGTAVWHLRLAPGFECGTLTEAPVMPDRLVRADGYPLLEFIVTRLLGRRDGLLIHASTAIVDGGAHVFVGHSGAGKSTMAAIAEAAGARIPTDDRTIITVADGAVMAWGTPWHGSLIRKSPEGAPLRGLYLLQQAPLDRLEPMTPSRAVKELFVRLIQPRLDASEVQETLRLLEGVVERTPANILHFRPGRAAFDLAIGAVDRGGGAIFPTRPTGVVFAKRTADDHPYD
jgi:hypothetical protein